MNPAGRYPLPAGHLPELGPSLYRWMRAAVAAWKGFRVQPEDRAELGAVDAGVADESKQFCILLERRGLGFADLAPVAFVIGRATCRAAPRAARPSMS
jgi:hypothetical protein